MTLPGAEALTPCLIGKCSPENKKFGKNVIDMQKIYW